MFNKIHHVGIAVVDLEQAAELYEKAFGMTRGLHRALPDRGVEVQFMHLQGTSVELLAPIGEDSQLTRFLARRGPGMHHLCYEVDDIRAAIAQLVGQNIEMIDLEPRPGAEGKLVAFALPRTTGGVLIELQEA